MAVSLNAKSVHDDTSAGTPASSFTSTQLTIAAGATLLIVKIKWDGTVTSPTVTWDSGGSNQACTLVIASPVIPLGLGETCAIYALVNPTSGNKTLSVSWTNAVNYGACMEAWNGTVTSSVAAACNNTNTASNSGTATSPVTITITTATSGAATACFVDDQATITGMSGATGSWTTVTGSGGAGWENAGGASFAAMFEANGATATIGYTHTGTAAYAGCGCNIVVAAASTVNWGFESLNPQPRRPTPRAGTFRMRGDEGTPRPFTQWLNAGWEIQPPPPRRPTPRAAGWLRGDDGNEAPLITWFNAGWEIQPPPPRRPTPRVGTFRMRGDEGAQRPFVQWYNSGWEIQAHQPRRPTPRSEPHGDEGTQNPFTKWLNAGWEIQAHQPPHRRPERGAPLIRSDDGNEAPFVLWTNAGWEIQSHQPRRPTPRSEPHGDDGIQRPFVFWNNYGWDIQPFQPSHPRPERSAAWLIGDTGTQAVFVSVVITVPAWGWDVQPVQPPYRINRLPALLRGDDGTQAAFIKWLNTGWEIQAHQPRRPTPRFDLRGDDGTQAAFINWLVDGWQVQSFQPSHPRPERAAAWLVGDTGTQAVFVPAVATIPTWGWEFQAPMLRQFGIRGRAAEGRSDFVAFDMQPWTEVQSFQPPYRRFNIQGGDLTTLAPFVFVAPPLPNWAWEVQAFQPPHPRPERAGAFMRGDEGTEAQFIRWLNSGWEVQPWQPPRRYQERRGAILQGDSGTQQVFIRWLFAGWEVQPFQPPHRTVSQRAAGFMTGYPGIDAPYIFVPPVVVPLRLRTLMGHGL